MGTPPPSPTVPLLEDAAWVRRLARGLAADAHEADDLAQEAWVVALESDGLGRGRAWLGGVLRRVAWKAKRGAGRRAHHEAGAARPEAVDPAAELVARAALSGELIGAVMQLEEPCRSALLLRYLEELPPRAIAKRLGVPVRTVAARLSRGLARLRADFDAKRGGREAWLPAVVALGGGGAKTAGASAGAILLGTKAKVALAVVLVALAALGVRELARPKAEQPGSATTELARETAGEADAGSLPLAATSPEERRAAAVASAAPAAVPSGRIVIRGRVFDAAFPELGIPEAPAEGAALSVWLSPREFREPPALEPPVGGGTAADGRFELELDDPGYRPAYLAIGCAGSATHRGSGAVGSVVQDSAVSGELLVLRPAHGVLRGSVRDERGQPLAGALVRASVETGEDVTTRSAEDGAFALQAAGLLWTLRAEAPGHALLSAPPVRPRAAGGYDEAVLVLARAGALRVHALDAEGRAVEGVALRLQLAPEELPAGSEPAPRFEARTDAQGLAELAPAWIGRKLEVSLAGRTFDRMLDGRLVRAGAPDGEALVVPERGLLEVELRCAGELVVRGTVVLADGTRAPNPSYEIADTGRAEWDAGRRLRHGSGDESGRFEVRLGRDEVKGQLAVLAADGELDGHWTAGSTFEQAARAVLDPGTAQGAGETVLEALLALRPTQSIAGRVVGAEGAPLRPGWEGLVCAVPAGAGQPHALTSLGREAWTRTQGGQFRIPGLADGLYDLYAARHLQGLTAGGATGFVRVADVPAGTTGLEVVVASERRVRVHLHLEHAGPPPDWLGITLVTFEPRDGRAPPAAAPQQIEVAGLPAWTEGALACFNNRGQADTSAGRFRHVLLSTKEVEGYVMQLGEGWYQLGIEPRASGGELTHVPVATKLVYLSAGDCDVRFHLAQAAPLRGRVEGGSAALLAVGLVDAGGNFLPQHVGSASTARTLTFMELNAAGEFSFTAAPVGRCTLRVGTPAELAAGAFQREYEVEVPAASAEPGEPLVLRL